MAEKCIAADICDPVFQRGYLFNVRCLLKKIVKSLLPGYLSPVRSPMPDYLAKAWESHAQGDCVTTWNEYVRLTKLHGNDGAYWFARSIGAGLMPPGDLDDFIRDKYPSILISALKSKYFEMKEFVQTNQGIAYEAVAISRKYRAISGEISAKKCLHDEEKLLTCRDMLLKFADSRPLADVINQISAEGYSWWSPPRCANPDEGYVRVEYWYYD